MENTTNNRGINRHQWAYPELKAELDNSQASHAQILQRLKQLITIRTVNSRRFIPMLYSSPCNWLMPCLASGARYGPASEYFCIYNVSTEQQTLSLRDTNLIVTDSWLDLVSGQAIKSLDGCMMLLPYQVVWISNITNGARS